MAVTVKALGSVSEVKESGSSWLIDIAAPNVYESSHAVCSEVCVTVEVGRCLLTLVCVTLAVGDIGLVMSKTTSANTCEGGPTSVYDHEAVL